MVRTFAAVPLLVVVLWSGGSMAGEEVSEVAVPFATGSELYVKRTVLKIGYHHAGVYIGDGQVVHVNAEPLGALKDLWDGKAMVNVVVTSFEEFAGDGEVLLGPTVPKFEPEEIVSRAKAEIGKPWKYDAEDNNCQHFSSERVSGKAVSPESKEMRQALTAVQDSLKAKAEELKEKAKTKADDVTGKVKGWFE